jgi:hypothetical protein
MLIGCQKKASDMLIAGDWRLSLYIEPGGVDDGILKMNPVAHQDRNDLRRQRW